VITLDRPFGTPLDATSFINVGPFRGRALFHGNRYTDGGGSRGRVCRFAARHHI
jgi:hypothetical protein